MTPGELIVGENIATGKNLAVVLFDLGHCFLETVDGLLINNGTHEHTVLKRIANPYLSCTGDEPSHKLVVNR